MIKIAIFASGSGSNAQQIIKHFENHEGIRVKLILTNNPEAYIIERARKLKVECKVFSRIDFYETGAVSSILEIENIDYIVLAGFLWLIPKDILQKFSGRIINIHPALLPNYGGKGMYGNRVHQAVIEAGEKETGITIHYVNEEYDAGKIIFQATCPVHPDDTPEEVQQRVHALEHKYFPAIIEKVINKSLTGK